MPRAMVATAIAQVVGLGALARLVPWSIQEALSHVRFVADV